MKITIVGGGNAGCLTALHYAYYTTHRDDIEIELIYDPTISPERVGQASVLSTPCLLWEALDFDWYNNKLDAVFKSGILYENWGKKNKEVFHPFPADRMAMHFEPKKLQEVILNSGMFNVVEDNIDVVDDIDSDFIFDCKGKPKELGDYEELPNPVNSAILGVGKTVDADMHWTRAVATPDGWCFIIPNKNKPSSYGYIYNRNITSKEKATENFHSLFDIESNHNLNFRNYLAKNPVRDNRIIKNGNALFFLEPLESQAVEAYATWNKITFDMIVLKARSIEDGCEHIKRYTRETANFILWHYKNGSAYDTPFWDYANTLQIVDPKFDKMVKMASAPNLHPWQMQALDKQDEVGYGQWSVWNFKNWIKGVAA